MFALPRPSIVIGRPVSYTYTTLRFHTSYKATKRKSSTQLWPTEKL